MTTDFITASPFPWWLAALCIFALVVRHQRKQLEKARTSLAAEREQRFNAELRIAERRVADQLRVQRTVHGVTMDAPRARVVNLEERRASKAPYAPMGDPEFMPREGA